MLEPLTLAAIGGTFFLAGSVKGVIGLGLPTVSLAVLTVALDLPTAMALLIVPSFVTNLWQGLAGGELTALLRRLWPFLLAATATVWAGALAVGTVDLKLLAGLLGVLLIAYATISLSGFRLHVAVSGERWAGPLIGGVNGVLTGMTGSFVVPGVLYLQALGLSRNALVQSMGILFTLSTVALALALEQNSLWTWDKGIVSAGAVIPALLGMALGQRIRTVLSEARFRQVFFWSLFVLGLYLGGNAVLGP